MIKEKEAAAPPNADLRYPPGLTGAARSLSPRRQAKIKSRGRGKSMEQKQNGLLCRMSVGGMRECSFSFALKYKNSVPFEIFKGVGVKKSG